jgi:hypothetical protein
LLRRCVIQRPETQEDRKLLCPGARPAAWLPQNFLAVPGDTRPCRLEPPVVPPARKTILGQPQKTPPVLQPIRAPHRARQNQPVQRRSTARLKIRFVPHAPSIH